MKFLFWICLLTPAYAFLGYAMILRFLVQLRRLRKRKKVLAPAAAQSMTLIIAAYDEASVIEAKIRNTKALRYPPGMLRVIYVSDGSTDRTAEIIRSYPDLELLHAAERRGKIHAVDRAAQLADTDLVAFTDANTFLNADALLLLARHYADPKVGAVSGEKRVRTKDVSDATAGEGFYWRYESALKRWDAELCTVVGAAGELFSLRTRLYEPVPPDTVLDDFMLSMNVVRKGYSVAYEPGAVAEEAPSANAGEEWKRKVRIAAGGIQSILRLPTLLNPFRYGVAAFQYFSHRVLRCTVVPYLLLAGFILNITLALHGAGAVYGVLLLAQAVFYGMALVGSMLALRRIKLKLFFVPYYFCLMNGAIVAGHFRYFGRREAQTVLWEKAARKPMAMQREELV